MSHDRVQRQPETSQSSPEIAGPRPLIGSQDKAERYASNLLREFVLRASEPALVFRQGGRDDGYALVVPQLQGERLLTVPGLHEADFMVHGNPGTTVDALAAFVAECLAESKADLLKIPLLTREDARELCTCLAGLLPTWHWDYGLAAIRPTVDKQRAGWRARNSLTRAYSRATSSGLVTEQPTSLPIDDVLELHTRRWGPNRSRRHFQMMDELAQAQVAKMFSVRDDAGRLLAFQFDFVTEQTRHQYHTLTDHRQHSGVGNIAFGWSWQSFVEETEQRYFSFGRGSERYKYRYANSVHELFELRGFFSPIEHG